MANFPCTHVLRVNRATGIFDALHDIYLTRLLTSIAEFESHFLHVDHCYTREIQKVSYMAEMIKCDPNLRAARITKLYDTMHRMHRILKFHLLEVQCLMQNPQHDGFHFSKTIPKLLDGESQITKADAAFEKQLGVLVSLERDYISTYSPKFSEDAIEKVKGFIGALTSEWKERRVAFTHMLEACEPHNTCVPY